MNSSDTASSTENVRQTIGTQWPKPLLAVAVIGAVETLASLIGLLVDQRELVGAPIWAEPLKFSISSVIYSVTGAWLIGQLTRHRRAASRAGTVAFTAASGLAIHDRGAPESPM